MEQEKVYLIQDPGEDKIVLSLQQEEERGKIYFFLLALQQGLYHWQLALEHCAARTWGRIEVRALVAAKAKIKIQGRIKIFPTARGSDSFLNLKTIFIGPTAQNWLEPQLEIETYPVRAGHAATSSGFDLRALTYLRARGISPQQGQQLLLQGFFYDLLKTIKSPQLRSQTRQRLKDALLKVKLDEN